MVMNSEKFNYYFLLKDYLEINKKDLNNYLTLYSVIWDDNGVKSNNLNYIKKLNNKFHNFNNFVNIFNFITQNNIYINKTDLLNNFQELKNNDLIFNINRVYCYDCFNLENYNLNSLKSYFCPHFINSFNNSKNFNFITQKFIFNDYDSFFNSIYNLNCTYHNLRNNFMDNNFCVSLCYNDFGDFKKNFTLKNFNLIPNNCNCFDFISNIINSDLILRKNFHEWNHIVLNNDFFNFYNKWNKNMSKTLINFNFLPNIDIYNTLIENKIIFNKYYLYNKNSNYIN